MKKFLILLVMVGLFAISCEDKTSYIGDRTEDKTEDDTPALALDNTEVNIPKSVSDTADPIHYVHITSNGSWTAKLETQDGNFWCWLEDSYVNAGGNRVKIVKGVTYVDGYPAEGMTDRFVEVKGSGSVYLPLHYITASANRYATLTVTHSSGKQCVLRITQK